MKMRIGSLLPVFLLLCWLPAHAETIYTFTGANGVSGTDWTLVDTTGYIPDNTNVLSLVTTSTDFFSLGTDYGPLVGIGDAGEQSGNSVCTGASTPCFEINMGIVSPFGSGTFVIPFFFAGNNGTSGTFEDLQTGSTLTITSTPEPSTLLTVAVGFLVLIGRRRYLRN